MAETCAKCRTPLDEQEQCVTCAAEAEGLTLVGRSGFAQAREMMTLLEDQGVEAEMEKVPPSSKEEHHHPKWNLYVPAADAEKAGAFLKRDWADLLADPAAAAAAARGEAALDLDAGGEIDCPACGHRFAVSAQQADCPECGLSLGVGEGVPGEGREGGGGERA
jgi:uncharacterized Zn finger protein (UPF0148 family)